MEDRSASISPQDLWGGGIYIRDTNRNNTLTVLPPEEVHVLITRLQSLATMRYITPSVSQMHPPPQPPHQRRQKYHVERSVRRNPPPYGREPD